MKRYRRRGLIQNRFIALFGLSALLTTISARDLKATIPYIPGVAESTEKGAFIDFLKALDEVYTDGVILIEQNSWPRSIANVVNGTADFHLPMISNPKVLLDSVGYRFASTPMGVVCIVIYTRIAKPLSKASIEQATPQHPFPYAIELQGALDQFFVFSAQKNYELIQSFNRLVNGRIDAVIAAQEDGDTLCKQYKFKTIKRELWDCKDDMVVIRKGVKGDEVDKILSDCMAKLIKNGTLKEIRKRTHVPYVEWQPYQMGW
ncbi:hypothetical protein JW979_00250 [bacterium]|nr:hypothetical protein [candidate division CSSED10-310 bacterium]